MIKSLSRKRIATAPENTERLKTATNGAPRIKNDRLRKPLPTANAMIAKESFLYSIAAAKKRNININMII